MEEAKFVKLRITMKNERMLTITVMDIEMTWLFDRLFGRTEGTFQNFVDINTGVGYIINLNEVMIATFKEIDPTSKED